MPKRMSHRAGLLAKKRIAAATLADKTISAGRELWQVRTDGKCRTIVTSAASATAMDRAMTIFAPALKRLADR